MVIAFVVALAEQHDVALRHLGDDTRFLDRARLRRVEGIPSRGGKTRCRSVRIGCAGGVRRHERAGEQQRGNPRYDVHRVVEAAGEASILRRVSRAGGAAAPERRSNRLHVSRNSSMRIHRLRFVVALFIAAALGNTYAADRRLVKSEKASFNIVTLVQGLEHPWSIAWLPDGRMLVTERPGRLRIVSSDFKLDPKPVEGVPRVVARGQGGLFEVAVHPDYAKNGWIYISYNGPGAGGHGTELIRAKLDGHRLVDRQLLFKAERKTSSDIQFGGRVVFDGKGHVFLTLGDFGEMDRAQELDEHAGSVIRLNEDGSVPKDNPFVGRSGAKPEIYSYGHRNIEGAALHPRTGELWTHEHGPQGGDEINIVRPGRNYGWPVITYGVNYGSGTKIGEGTRKAGMEQPLYKWVPSIAPSGMAFYEGDKFPAWRGNLLVGALKDEMVVRLELEGGKVTKEERMMVETIGRIRDVRVGRDGYVYLLTDEKKGVLARLEPAR
jgi:glucose/arabinose dehydrogenase